jgi:hypothetical protein
VREKKNGDQDNGTDGNADLIFSGSFLSVYKKGCDLVPIKFQRDEPGRDAPDDHLYDHAARSWVEICICVGRHGNEAYDQKNISL